jgi:hypothetical protein
MKRLIYILLAMAIFSALGCLAIYAIFAYAAPVVLGAAVFGKSLNTIAGAFSLPTWATVLLFLALGPAFLLWLLRWIFPQKRRRQMAILIVIMASLYALAKIVEKHESDIATAFSCVERICVSVERVDPATTSWFFPSGKPRLFYAHPTTNVWIFCRGGYPGAHDPVTGIQVEAVNPSTWQEWEADQESQRKVEMAKEDESAALKAVTAKAAADLKEQQATVEQEKANEQHLELELTVAKQQEEQRKTAEAARKLASEVAAKQVSSSQLEQARKDQRRYWMIDGHGREFGPVSLAQLQQWIAEGRANANTSVYAEGWRGWQLLGSILPCPAPVIYYHQPSYYVRIW